MEMNVKTGIYAYNNETYNFNFYTSLSAAMKIKFVDSVVGLLIDEFHYNSLIRDLIFDFFIVDIFTDIDIEELKNSAAFLNDAEQFLEETNIVEVVKANVSPLLFDELNNAVDKSVQYLTGIHYNPLNEALARLASTIESKVKEVDLDSMMTMVQKFANMTEDFTVENAVNAYMNSDIHNKNLAEIEEAKNIRAELAKDLDKAIKVVNKDNNK